MEQYIRLTRHGGLISLMGYFTNSKATDTEPELSSGVNTLRAPLEVSADMVDMMVQLVEDRKRRPPTTKVHKSQHRFPDNAESTF